MNLKLIPPIIALLALISCAPQKPTSTSKESELIGVWSGLLFQTTSEYDSIVIKPVIEPKEAFLYKDGKFESYPLSQKNKALHFRGKQGLRFDASFADDTQSLFGLITKNLWVQSLNFQKRDDKWVSKIVKPEIIDTDYQVYLEFYKDSLGNINAVLQSNKENRELHFKIDSTFIDSTHISFKISNKRFGISAKHLPEKQSIILTYKNPGRQRAITLKKLNPLETVGYKPRKPKQSYSYQTPKMPDSTLPTASLEEVGISSSMLELMNVMNNGNYDHIHSIVVTKDNKLVFEEYFHGYDREYLHNIKSAFKSMASLWIGKIKEEDKSIKVENALVDYYPKYKILDTQKKKMTIHHALTMSTGLKLENEDVMQWKNQDWAKYKLQLPMEHAPGEKYQYSSGGMNLLSGVIKKSVDKYAPLHLYEQILKPLGINRYQMRISPVERPYLAGDFFLRPIDLAKFGVLILNKGQWNNQQLIDPAWISASTKPHIKGSWPKNSDYGYLWRLLERKVGGKPMKTIEAWGNGGQFLIIIPEANMSITFTGGNYNLFPAMENKPFELLNKYILPAVKIGNR